MKDLEDGAKQNEGGWRLHHVARLRARFQAAAGDTLRTPIHHHVTSSIGAVGSNNHGDPIVCTNIGKLYDKSVLEPPLAVCSQCPNESLPRAESAAVIQKEQENRKYYTHSSLCTCLYSPTHYITTGLPNCAAHLKTCSILTRNA